MAATRLVSIRSTISSISASVATSGGRHGEPVGIDAKNQAVLQGGPLEHLSQLAIWRKRSAGRRVLCQLDPL